MKILLARCDVNSNRPDKDGKTPLYCAAQDGNEEMVKILLGRGDLNPNRPDENGEKPLCCTTVNSSVLNGQSVRPEP